MQMTLKEKKNLQKIHRWNFKTQDRIGKYLRLDRNERVDPFDKKDFKKILKSIKNEELSAYPETTTIQELFAKNEKLKFEETMVTTGSDTAIRHVFETFVNTNDHVLTLDNTYAMYEVYAQIMGAKISYFNYEDDYSINVNKLIKETKNIKLLIIANPNLSGTIINNKDLEKIFIHSKNKFLILIDEAYYGFYQKTQVTKIKKYNNLIITRSFSKTYGIPGVRIGAIFSNEKIITQLNKVRLSHAISSVGASIGKFLIKNKKISKKNINQIINARIYLISKLREKKIKCLNSHANFIYIGLNSIDQVNRVIKLLEIKKILVKGPYTKKPFNNMIRVTVGKKDTMNIFLKYFLKAYNSTI
jgi:histidinol-phosphate aminotransferase